MKLWGKIIKVLKFIEESIFRLAKIILALWVMYQALLGQFRMEQLLDWFL